MKYILVSLISLFLFTNVVRAEETFHQGDEIRGAYVQVENVSLKLSFFYNSSDEVVYVSNPMNYQVNENIVSEVVDFDAEKWDKIQKIMYYGYGYKEHTQQKWYVITQVEIWKILYGIEEVYYLDKMNGNKVSKYDEEVNELNTLIDNHEVVPDFGERIISLNYNESIVLNDNNAVLENYEVIEINNVETKIKNNELEILSNTKDNFKLELVKKNSRSSSPVVYQDEESFVFVPGNLEEIKYEYFFVTKFGYLNIELKIEDVYCEACNDATYAIFNESGKIREFSINDKLDFILGEGIYYLKQVSKDKGFLADKEKYAFEISDRITTTMQLVVSKISNEISINKLNYKINDDVSTFEVYDSLMNKVKTFEMKNGSYVLKLGYGNYILKHVKNDNKYSLVDDLNLKVRTDGLDQNKKLVSDLISVVSVPDTSKRYSYINLFILIFGLTLLPKKRFWMKN